MAALLGAIANIDRLAAFRRDCERGFSLAMSTKSNQCQSDFFLKSGHLPAPVADSMQAAAVPVLVFAAAISGCAQRLQQIRKMPSC